MGAESRLVKGIRVHSELLRDRFGTVALESRPDDASEPVGKEGNAMKESLDLRRAELTRGGVEIGFDDLTNLFAEAGEGILPPGARSPVIAELIAGDTEEPRDKGRRFAGIDLRVGDEKDLLGEVVRIVLVRETCRKIPADKQAILPDDETELIRLTPIHGGENSLKLKCRFIPHIGGSSPEISFLTGITEAGMARSWFAFSDEEVPLQVGSLAKNRRLAFAGRGIHPHSDEIPDRLPLSHTLRFRLCRG
jgi:hypothetical protein